MNTPLSDDNRDGSTVPALEDDGQSVPAADQLERGVEEGSAAGDADGGEGSFANEVVGGDEDELDEDDLDDDEDEDRDEGDIAGDFLEELLDIADIDGDFDIEDRDGRVLVSISAEGDGKATLAKLGDAETVEALQHLTRLAVQAETGEFSGVILDVAGSRDARREELRTIVESAVERLDAGAASAALPRMSSYERKIVHDLAAELGCVSESEGEGRDRHPILRRGAEH